MVADRNKVHGLSNIPEYGIWNEMKNRCHNPNNSRYWRYGGRGISVHPAWVNDFDRFIADMGCRPAENLSIERINNDGNYEPGNCRWATDSEQSRNTMRTNLVEVDEFSACIVDWCNILYINRNIPYKLAKKIKTSPREAIQAIVYSKMERAYHDLASRGGERSGL
jgi:hypothetical protein